MPAPYVPLHCHTEYSLLDGAIRIDDLAKRAKQFDYGSVALTDHGALYGAVTFHKAMTKAGIQPIIGCEAYVAPGKLDLRETDAHGRHNYHLVLLARNATGYRNLCRLLTAAHTRGFYYKPRIDKETLAQCSEGLIGMSACLHGEIASAVLRADMDGARAVAEHYAKLFGEGNFWLEIMENGLPEQARANQGIAEIARQTGLGLVATNDCHYLEESDAESHEVLLCIQTQTTLDNPGRMRMQTREFWFKDPDTVARQFAANPEAVANTLEVARRCEPVFTFGQHQFPTYTLPDPKRTLDEELAHLATEGLTRRMREAFGDEPPARKRELWTQYKARLDMELGVIRDMKFPGYFLIVYDFIRWARANGIPVGPGRGSAAGSLVAYSLGITNLDPIPYHLLFERFLNPERVSLPDIDVDFCMDNRDRVIHYMTERYGADYTAQIGTFGTMQARLVVRDVGRALGIALGEVDRLAKLVPEGAGVSLKKSVQDVPELAEAAREGSPYAVLMRHALTLEGLRRHTGMHAAGVVVGSRPLSDQMPLGPNKDGGLVCQFDMKGVEEIGLIKFDFLGLKTLTVIHDAQARVNEGRPHGNRLDIDRIPLDDPAVYDLISSGDTDGIFQLESRGIRDLCRSLAPRTFEDLIALVALYRPGPLQSGMVADFVDRRHARKEVSYPHPLLETCLEPTYGVIVYQEQVMQIAQTLSGYTLGEADLLRRAMGKKKPEEMAKQKNRFVDGATAKGIDAAKATEIFNLMEQFADYGFNKSHSAAYALIAYQTAYLKAHHRSAFMAAHITSVQGNTDKVAQYVETCRDIGIAVSGPDINTSTRRFEVEGPGLRFGFTAIKGLGDAAVDAILAERQARGSYTGLLDFCDRIDRRKVNRKALDCLIRSGCFDSLGGTRAQYLAYADTARKAAEQKAKGKAPAQAQLTLLPADEIGHRHLTDQLPEVEPSARETELLAERELLGAFVSGHPLDAARKRLPPSRQGLRLRQRSETPSNQTRRYLVSITSHRVITTRNGQKMAFIQVADENDACEVVVFPSTFPQLQGILDAQSPFFLDARRDPQGDGGKLLAEALVPLPHTADSRQIPLPGAA